jgi:Co/Zn/Cd efflux system component
VDGPARRHRRSLRHRELVAGRGSRPGAILLDRVPDRRVAEGVRRAIEAEGDQVVDLHLWRLGPGHLGAVVAVATAQGTTRGPEFYHRLLTRFPALSHVTVETRNAAG